jgi:uncharacterized protein (UPF0147 family)|tara:strand:+ start:193 stop:441 length:249 start_codon:yes stop_codon:yes gene_type:complete
MAETQFDNVSTLLSEISEDPSTPKNVRSKIGNIMNILGCQDHEDSIKKDKVLCELDELTNDNNIQQFTRTQIWNVVSLLENV